MLRVVSRQAEISAESRGRLMAATAELLAEGGLRAATVQAVSDRAGISRGSISFHFGSKEGLIVAVVNGTFDLLCERITAVFESSDRLGWDGLFDAEGVVLSDERFRIFATVALEAMGESGPVAEAFAVGQGRVRDLYAEYIARHGLVVRGVDPVDVATALRSLTLGLNVHRRFNGDVITLQQAIVALQAVASLPRPKRAQSKRR